MHLGRSLNGLSLRFMLDSVIWLSPDLESPARFRGTCPFTHKKRGLILDEDKELIQFTDRPNRYVGFLGFREFLSITQLKMKSKELKITQDLLQFNEKFKDLYRSSIAEFSRLDDENQKISVDGRYDLEAEISIEFLLSENHRLFHPESDNVICTYTIHKGEEFDEEDEVHFNELCWPIKHLLVDHKLDLEDLLSTERFLIDFVIIHQSSHKRG